MVLFLVMEKKNECIFLEPYLDTWPQLSFSFAKEIVVLIKVLKNHMKFLD